MLKILVFLALTSLSFEIYEKDIQLHCLTTNIYYEARGEPLNGQLAVALVTKNRAAKSNICNVVYAKHQFSWTSKFNKTKRDNVSWGNAEHIAKISLAYNYSFYATHYHSKYVNPNWNMKKIAIIGNHIFY